MQSSIYNMDLENEIHFIPALFYNVNLDPTRRYGSETSASLRVSDTVLLRGGMAYTRAVFREGPFAGNDVPLVSRYTASAGVTWNIWQNYLVFDATLRAWSERFMDNDQANTQRRIPADATVDLKLSGAYEHFFWSLSVNNLFNALYYDYADREFVHAGPLLGLSAARPNLHGEGRRDVLTAIAGSAPAAPYSNPAILSAGMISRAESASRLHQPARPHRGLSDDPAAVGQEPEGPHTHVRPTLAEKRLEPFPRPCRFRRAAMTTRPSSPRWLIWPGTEAFSTENNVLWSPIRVKRAADRPTISVVISEV